MAGLAGLVSEDSRPLLQRMRRKQLWDLAKANNIPYPDGAAKTVMIPILEGAGVNPLSAGDWEQVQNKDENGNVSVEMYPVEKPHASSFKNINYDELLSSKEVVEDENTKLKAQVEKLTKMMEQMMGEKPIESSVSDQEAEKGGDLDLSAMGHFELKKLCKERGIKTKNTDKKPDLIKVLEDGQDTTKCDE